MNLSSLIRVVERSKKRVGRGYGSGKGGHNSGRGTKGQKARTKVGLLFEGTKSKKSLVKRLPLLRGKGKFKPANVRLAINVEKFASWPKSLVINPENIAKQGLSDGETLIKIVGKGSLPTGVDVQVPVTSNVKVQASEKGTKMKANVKIANE